MLVVLLISLILEWFILASSSSNQRIRLLVVGGSGRVGGSAVRAMLETFQCKQLNIPDINVQIDIAGRSQSNFENFLSRSPNLRGKVQFTPLDIYCNPNEIDPILYNYDLIVNTAGPFQGLKESPVLMGALRTGVDYIDVCDDITLSRIVRSEKYQKLAKSSGSKAIISAGIWPGGSSLFAQDAILRSGGESNVKSCKFSFFTAGSGGAGPTILAATFLLLGQDVLVYKNNEKVLKKSVSDMKSVNFGSKLGFRDVARLNLIECESCYQSTGIPSVETYFGTAPKFWNLLFVLMATWIPQHILQNRSLMGQLGVISLPLVRLVDKLVGSINSIRVDLQSVNNSSAYAIMTHNDMEKAVGDSLAAFVKYMILKKEFDFTPGVYFPEEIPSIKYKESVLQDICSAAIDITYSSD